MLNVFVQRVTSKTVQIMQIAKMHDVSPYKYLRNAHIITYIHIRMKPLTVGIHTFLRGRVVKRHSQD